MLFIESFAGTAAATQAVQAAYPTHASVALDVKYTSKMDLGTNSGMGRLVSEFTSILRTVFFFVMVMGVVWYVVPDTFSKRIKKIIKITGRLMLPFFDL